MGKAVTSLECIKQRAVVDDVTGCWNWSKARNEKGYGVVRYMNDTRLAHRVSLALACGYNERELLLVRHSCDNPRCVNPSHLLLGDAQSNASDMVERGRSQRWSGHWHSKLHEEDVPEIRQRISIGESQAAIAALFGVSQPAICAVAMNAWRHVI